MQEIVSTMVTTSINNICTKVVQQHVETISFNLSDNNTKFIVYHSNKQAIFKLKNANDTFGTLKKNIAEYFGLPIELISIKNAKGEIMLSN